MGIFENLKASGAVATASSEEEPTEVAMGGEGYSVAFDPLDGSSIIDTNFAVGTIFGIWPGSKLVGVKGSELSAAGLGVYGPRTTITLAVDGIEGAHEFMLIDDMSSKHGQWVLSQSFHTIGEGKLFAPGNLRATKDNAGYEQLFNYWYDNQYQLRYTGGMVPDVNQIGLRERVSSQTLLPRLLRPSFVFSTRLLLLDTLLRRPVESLPMESNLSLTFQLLELRIAPRLPTVAPLKLPASRSSSARSTSK